MHKQHAVGYKQVLTRNPMMEEFCKYDNCVIIFDTSNCEPPNCCCGGFEMEHVRVAFSTKSNRKSVDSTSHQLSQGFKDVRLTAVYRESGNVVIEIADDITSGAILTSVDDFVVFLEKSSQEKVVQAFPTSELDLLDLAKRTGVDRIDLATTKSEDVVYEIFHSIIREVRDEINIPESSLSWPLLLGLIRNLDNGGKPHASFLINCDLTKDEIEELYSKGGPEAYESSKIFFIKKEELMSLSANELHSRLGNLSPCGKATLYLYFNSYKSTCSN